MDQVTRARRLAEILPPEFNDEPSVVKEWCRRHENGCVGVVVAWSDGSYTGGYSEYLPRRGGVQMGPRLGYETLAQAFASADADAGRRGHTCGDGCALWGEVSSPYGKHIG